MRTLQPGQSGAVVGAHTLKQHLSTPGDDKKASEGKRKRERGNEVRGRWREGTG